MPFEKNYDQRLRTFPSALRDCSIQYRELKKIIGRLVDELNGLGFSPETHRQLVSTSSEEQTFSYPPRSTPEGITQRVTHSKILYEVISKSGKSFPQLRVYMTGRDHSLTSTSASVSALPVETTGRELVIPLVHDAEFFNLFEGNIRMLTSQMETIHSEFLKSLLDLARMITDTCQPASAAGNYHPYSSVSTHPGTVEVKVRRMKSDLYAWREIFAVFVQSDVFEHFRDGKKVEWNIEESENRLNAFVDNVGRRKGGPKLKEKFKHSQSPVALQIFIAHNFLILNIKKAFQANIEAIQKLVNKHTERTALPLSCSFSENANLVSIGQLHQSSRNPISVLIHPRLFIQEFAEKLFPIVPNQEDYACAICTNIAFKPIRLSCTHLFCARCLVKMQRRGEGNCPMCRAPSILEANAKNVDWGLLNFMEDWFPREAGEKMRDNEKEITSEQLAEWRKNDIFCTIM